MARYATNEKMTTCHGCRLYFAKRESLTEDCITCPRCRWSDEYFVKIDCNGRSVQEIYELAQYITRPTYYVITD